MVSDKPKIRCVTYGGYIGWFLRKHFSFFTSSMYLEWQYFIRKKLFKRYIDFFEKKDRQGEVIQPCLISIETINRCNGTCAFCPANKYSETRPFMKMDENLFKKIIHELSEIGYSGYLNLYVNNEPMMDKRIEEWYIYAKRHLPDAKMLLYTNGTLLTIERFKRLIPAIDKCIINNYTDNFRLHENIKILLKFVRKNREYWKKDIIIQVRYIREILTNRAGAAPNKQKKRLSHRICIMPYTDMTIYPDGTAGLCCNDALEKTAYGNLRDDTIMGIWSGNSYRKLRRKIGTDRSTYSFCAGCDFIDAGIRDTLMVEKIKNHNPLKSR